MDDGNKKEFMRGMQIVFGANEDRNTQMGMQVAIQMMGEIKQLENEGVVVDRAKAMNAFKKAFMADSIDMETVQKASLVSVLSVCYFYKFYFESQRGVGRNRASRAGSSVSEFRRYGEYVPSARLPRTATHRWVCRLLSR